MFQWKVYSYQNINGKEKSFEKTFDNYDEYRNYMWGNSIFSGFLGWNGSFFDNYLDSFLDRRLALSSWSPPEENNLPVDISRYEEEVRKIDMDESEKRQRREQLESAKTRLTEYKEKFNNSGKKDLLKEVEADMKKIDEELKEISS